jgi:PBP1b-binding outer membrane lipoprotein LpoB
MVKMNKKYLIVVWVFILLFSGCVSMQDKSVNNDSANVSVSGDVTVSGVDRKGF